LALSDTGSYPNGVIPFFPFFPPGTITLNSEHCFHEKSPGNRKHLIDHACREDNDLSDVEAASRLSLRTSNLTTFRENVKARFFDLDAPGRRLLTASRARRGLRRKRMSRRQGYNSTLANDFLAYDDAFHYRNGLKDGAVVPAFVGAFGIPTYKAKSSPARADIEWLAKKMLVFMINEDYSSQVRQCPPHSPFSPEYPEYATSQFTLINLSFFFLSFFFLRPYFFSLLLHIYLSCAPNATAR
jgi:hypothetical protein